MNWGFRVNQRIRKSNCWMWYCIPYIKCNIISNRTKFQWLAQLEYPVRIFQQSPTFSCKFCQVKFYDIRYELSYCLLILCAAMRRNAYAYKPFPDLLHYLRLLPIERRVYSVAFESFSFLLACKADFVRTRLLIYFDYFLLQCHIWYGLIHDYLRYRSRMHPYILLLHFN